MISDAQLLRIVKYIYSISDDPKGLNDSYTRMVGDIQSVKEAINTVKTSLLFTDEAIKLCDDIVNAVDQMTMNPEKSIDWLSNLQKNYAQLQYLIEDTKKKFDKGIIVPEQISIVDSEYRKKYLEFYRSLYKVHLYCIFRLEDPQREKKIVKDTNLELNHWIEYYQSYDWKYANTCINTWVIHLLTDDGEVRSSRLQYYKGLKMYEKLYKSEDAKKLGELFYCIPNSKNEYGIEILFGIGNISNIALNNVDGMTTKDVATSIPRSVPQYFDIRKPIKCITSLLKGNTFCVSPYEFNEWLNYCLFYIKHNGKKGTFCPICGMPIANNQWICGKHYKLS